MKHTPRAAHAHNIPAAFENLTSTLDRWGCFLCVYIVYLCGWLQNEAMGTESECSRRRTWTRGALISITHCLLPCARADGSLWERERRFFCASLLPPRSPAFVEQLDLIFILNAMRTCWLVDFWRGPEPLFIYEEQKKMIKIDVVCVSWKIKSGFSMPLSKFCPWMKWIEQIVFECDFFSLYWAAE